jgi:leishmanolysin-like peptidase
MGLIFSSLRNTLLQNFDKIPHVHAGTEGKYGGSVALADYCPYIQEFSWRAKNVVVRGSHCYFEENNPRKLFFHLNF